MKVKLLKILLKKAIDRHYPIKPIHQLSMFWDCLRYNLRSQRYELWYNDKNNSTHMVESSILLSFLFCPIRKKIINYNGI